MSNMTPEDKVLRRDLVKLASGFPRGSDERRKLLAILTAEFDPNEIGELKDGPLEDEPDEPFMDGEFTQQEFQELGDKQEAGVLSDGQAETEPARMASETKTAAKRRAALEGTDKVLFGKLVRLAKENKDARGPVLNMLREAGLIEAGCEKLPAGAMRDNCENKSKGKKDDGKKDDGKAKGKKDDGKAKGKKDDGKMPADVLEGFKDKKK